jgi:hypothetical protein
MAVFRRHSCGSLLRLLVHADLDAATRLALRRYGMFRRSKSSRWPVVFQIHRVPDLC